jgi:hypothetical protein
VVAPGSEGFHNGKHLFFMDTIFFPGVSKLPDQKGHGVESLAVVLLEDSAEHIVGGVCANNKRVGGSGIIRTKALVRADRSAAKAAAWGAHQHQVVREASRSGSREAMCAKRRMKCR